MLMWIFISTLVFYYGAEFTKVSAARRRKRTTSNVTTPDA